MDQLQSGNMWNETVVQEVGFLVLSLFSHSPLSPPFHTGIRDISLEGFEYVILLLFDEYMNSLTSRLLEFLFGGVLLLY